jgi:hypothetical protein
VFYYFDFQDPAKRTEDNFLRSIITQILSPYAGIPNYSQTLENLYSTSRGGRESPKLYELRLALKEVIAEQDQLYIVIDALDECSDSERRGLLRWFRDAFAPSRAKFHLLVASRSEYDIEQTVSSLGAHSISISDAVVDKDIETFINSELSTRPGPWKHESSRNIKELIIRSLMEKANGV